MGIGTNIPFRVLPGIDFDTEELAGSFVGGEW